MIVAVGGVAVVGQYFLTWGESIVAVVVVVAIVEDNPLPLSRLGRGTCHALCPVYSGYVSAGVADSSVSTQTITSECHMAQVALAAIPSVRVLF
jgi:hypothetical protein